MERKYVFLLFIISFLLTNVVAYLDEGIRTFDYLNYLGDWIALFIYSSLFLGLPLLLFFVIKKQPRIRFQIALFGFIPVILLITRQLI